MHHPTRRRSRTTGARTAGTRTAGVLSAAGALLATALLTPGTATAAPPRAVVVPCGAVLTTSVRLAADVDCPGGEGLTLAADGIELNLNGHRLTGPGAAGGGVGVRVQAQGVTVRGGTVRGWGAGLDAGADYDEGEPERPVSASVRAARFEGNGGAVTVGLGGGVVVRDTWFTGNRIAGSSIRGGQLIVERSTADGNGEGFSSFEVEPGGLVLRESAVRRSRGSGVGCGQGGWVDLHRTSLQRNAVGVNAFQCTVRIQDSAFAWNGRHVQASLVEWDVVAFRCTTFTADGGPLGVPLRPCHQPPGGSTAPGTRVTGTFDAL
ncbi:hypothetical protein [Kineococcus sp. SYSU DK005]|uniref:hypothetical protein n=1 Tax=Kineococcus sp. SYSU DK005 TaxID=3383126 RepID=UPI003D7C4E20